jgi:hypothetical protein
MSALRDGAVYAWRAVAGMLCVLALLDLATLWMAVVYLPVTALWLQLAAFWTLKAGLSLVGARGLWRCRWWGAAIALLVLGAMVLLQQEEWQALAGRSPYRARFAWMGIWAVALGWPVLRQGRAERGD